jgi:hypothetical protein
MASFNQPLDGDIEVNPEIVIELDGIVDALVANQDFINKLRNAILKDARRRGNSYGQWASPKPTNQTIAPTLNTSPTRRIS